MNNPASKVTLSQAAREKVAALMAQQNLFHGDDSLKAAAIERLIAKNEPYLSLPLLYLLAESPKMIWQRQELIPWMSINDLVCQQKSYTERDVCLMYSAAAQRYPLMLPTATLLIEFLFYEDTEISQTASEALIEAAAHYQAILHRREIVPNLTLLEMVQAREVIATALLRGVERYERLHTTSPLEAFFLVTEPQHPLPEPVLTTLWNFRVTKAIDALFQSGGKNFCFYDVMLATLNSSQKAYSRFDGEMMNLENPDFAKRFLDFVSATPTAATRRHLARWNSLSWLDEHSEFLTNIVAGRELPFLHLLFCLHLSPEKRLDFLRWCIRYFSVEGRQAILTRLSTLPTAPAFSLLLDLVVDQNPAVCAQALRQIYALKGGDVDYVFLRHCHTAEPEIRKVIYDLKPEFRVRSLLARALHDPQWHDRSMGQIVANIDPETFDFLLKTLTQNHAEYRAAGVRVLAMTGLLPRAEKKLQQLLSDRNADVRCAIAAGFKNYPSEQARTILTALTRDSDSRVATTAQSSLAFWNTKK